MSESGFSGFKDLQEAMARFDTYAYPWSGAGIIVAPMQHRDSKQSESPIKQMPQMTQTLM